MTASNDAIARRWARAFRLPSRLQVNTQGRGDLGARLARTFRRLGEQDFDRVVVIGTDSPALSRGHLRRAFASLQDADAVLGPARDGGYYLIGLRLPRRRLGQLFSGIAWGTDRTYQQTDRKMKAAGLRVRRLSLSYDVDTAADLERLQRDLRRQPHLEPLRDWITAWERTRASR